MGSQRGTESRSSAASDGYKGQIPGGIQDEGVIDDPGISNTIGDFDVFR